MRRRAPPRRPPRRLRRRVPPHLPPALVRPGRAGLGQVLVDAPPHRHAQGAQGPAGDRQHVAHDRPRAPQARRRGGPPRGAPPHGVLPRRDAHGRGRAPGRGQGDPQQPRLRRPPRQGVRLRAPLPPRHRLRTPRRVLARAPPRRLHAPLLPVAGRRLRAPARRHRATDGRGDHGRRRGPARAAARVAAQRDVVRVRPPVRPRPRPRRGGARAEQPGGRRLRPARPAQLVRPPPLARPLRPAEHPGTVLPPRPARQPLRRPHHRRPPQRLAVRRQGLHRRAPLPRRRRQARRLRHDRGALGDGVPRDGHGGGAHGVGAGPAGDAPGRAGGGARRARPGRRAPPRRRRGRRRLARLPPRRHQGGPAAAPAGPAALLGPPRHVGRARGRAPHPRWHDGHGEHVGHNPRPRRVGGAGRVPAGAVHEHHRSGSRALHHGVGPPARAVRGRPEELPGEEPRHGHRRVLARHPAARAGAPPRRRRRPPGREAEAVVRDGGAARRDDQAPTPGVMTSP